MVRNMVMVDLLGVTTTWPGLLISVAAFGYAQGHVCIVIGRNEGYCPVELPCSIWVGEVFSKKERLEMLLPLVVSLP